MTTTTHTDQDAYDAYVAAGGKVTKAAEALGVPRTSFTTMVARHTALLAQEQDQPTDAGDNTEAPEPTEDTAKRDAVRDVLARRYHGAVDVTDEMIDAVLNGLDEDTDDSEDAEPVDLDFVRQHAYEYAGAAGDEIASAYADHIVTSVRHGDMEVEILDHSREYPVWRAAHYTDDDSDEVATVIAAVDEASAADVEAASPERGVWVAELTDCLCGCGGQTTRQFLQGHSAAYGKQLRAAYVDRSMTREQVLTAAAKVGDKFAGKLTRSLDNADRKATQATRPAAPKFAFPDGVLAPVQFHHVLVAEGTAPESLTTQTVYGWLKTVKHAFPHRYYTADGTVYDTPQTVDGVTVTRPGVTLAEGRDWYTAKFGPAA